MFDSTRTLCLYPVTVSTPNRLHSYLVDMCLTYRKTKKKRSHYKEGPYYGYIKTQRLVGGSGFRIKPSIFYRQILGR